MRSDQLISTKGNQIIGFLFLGWLLTLPFGAKILSVSIGFMTIYPNLLFSLALVPFAIPTLRKWSLLNKLIAFFLVAWFLIALVQLKMNWVGELYADPDAWVRKAILNVASSGRFSSDRTIAEYASDIWNVKSCPVS